MDNNTQEIRPDVLTYDDIRKMVPALDGHQKLVDNVLHFIGIDEVNRIHRDYCDTPGIEFAHRLINEEFKFQLRIDNLQTLAGFKDGPFITVSNHPFGSYDGILLLHIVGGFREDYKVMVNLILNNIQAMRPNFIAVDPLKSDDPEKKKDHHARHPSCHEARQRRASPRVLPRRSHLQAQQVATHRRPPLAAHYHPPYQTATSARHPNILPRTQLNILQHSRYDRLASAHPAPP